MSAGGIVGVHAPRARTGLEEAADDDDPSEVRRSRDFAPGLGERCSRDPGGGERDGEDAAHGACPSQRSYLVVHALRRLVLDEVPCVLDQDHRRLVALGERAAQAVGRSELAAEEAVLDSPEDERRRLDRGQPARAAGSERAAEGHPVPVDRRLCPPGPRERDAVGSQLVAGPDAPSIRAADEGSGHDLGAVRGHAPLREPRELEKEDVPRPPQLGRRAQHRPGEILRWWAVEHHELLDQRGPERGDAPGDRAAPVVADDDRPLAAERPDERGSVVDERPEVERPLELRLAVAAQVGCDRPVAGAGQGGKLVPPRAPELGEAVQAEHERPVLRPVGQCVERDSVRGEDERLHTRPSRTAVGESSHRRPNGHLAACRECL